MNRRSAIRALMGLPFLPLLASALPRRKGVTVPVDPTPIYFDFKPGTVIDTNASYRPGWLSANQFNSLVNEVNRLQKIVA